jgi:hypothetical protein
MEVGDNVDYREITKQLQSLYSGSAPAPAPAAGPLARGEGPPLCAAAAASPGVRRLSGAFSRTLDIFGWGAGRGAALDNTPVDEAALQQQVCTPLAMQPSKSFYYEAGHTM